MKRKKSHNKGQVFMMDYILGTLMFFALAIMGVMLIVQIVPNNTYEEINADNNFVSQILMSAGFPFNWTNQTVIQPGIADDYKLNLTKLARFDNLGYDQTRVLFQTPYDYLYFFENKTNILNISNCTHGYPIDADPLTCEPDMSSVNYDDLILSTRLIAHNGSIIRLVLYTWN